MIVDCILIPTEKVDFVKSSLSFPPTLESIELPLKLYYTPPLSTFYFLGGSGSMTASNSSYSSKVDSLPGDEYPPRNPLNPKNPAKMKT